MSYWRKAQGTYRAASARPGVRAAAIIATLSILLIGIAVATPASADEDYATYADVQAAQNSAAKKEALVKRIKAGLAALETKVETTQAAAEKAGTAAQVADQAFQEQSLKTEALQTQADTANAEAATAKQHAGELLVQQYRQSGNTDITIDLLLNSGDSSDILYSLGMSKTLVDQAQGIFAEATQAKNTAQSLTDQAAVAQAKLDELKGVADAKLAKASELADAAAAALQEQQDNVSTQEALLAELNAKKKSTEADYQKGVAAREKARLKALADQAKAAASSSPSGVQTADPIYSVDGQWATPAIGHITSGFGYRLSPFGGSGVVYHLGTDIGAGCGSNIYAAHGGTVSYSGWNGVYGNFLRIDIGDSVQNEYGHIINGGLLVKKGATVTAGQLIAHVGMTGGATGCHLHFGVRINGLVTDPVPFMRTNGITLGQ